MKLPESPENLKKTPEVVKKESSIDSVSGSLPLQDTKDKAEIKSLTSLVFSSGVILTSALSAQIPILREQILKSPSPKPLSGLDEEEALRILLEPSQEIICGIHLGSYEARHRVSRGEEKNIRMVIKVTAQQSNDPLKAAYYAPLPKDVEEIDIGNNLPDDVTSWSALKLRLPEVFVALDKALNNKIHVLVHCTQGVSRSAAVVIAYLVYRFNVTVERAQNFIKTRRPQVESRFLKCVQEIEADLQQAGLLSLSKSNPITASATLLLLAPPALKQEKQRLQDAIVAELKQHKDKGPWDKDAANCFTATVITAIRKNLYAALLKNPEDHGLPALLVSCVKQHLKNFPQLIELVQKNPDVSKALITSKTQLDLPDEASKSTDSADSCLVC